MASPTRIVALSANFIALMVVSNVLEEYLYARLPGFDFFETTATVELLLFAVASWCSRDAAAPRKAPLPLYGAMGVSIVWGSIGRGVAILCPRPRHAHQHRVERRRAPHAQPCAPSYCSSPARAH